MSISNGIRSLQSFVVLPILATNLLMAPVATNKLPTVAVLANEQNGTLFKDTADNQQKVLQEKAAKIDAYFGDKNLPLAGYGEKLVLEAEKNDLPWAMLAAIAMQESTGYKHACKSDPDNGFGWGSCRIKFNSIDHAIETVAQHLSGNHSRTAHYYKGKDVPGILRTYNSVRPTYVKEVQSIMNKIENYPIQVATTTL